MIHTEQKHDHYKTLETTLTTLNDHNIKINFDKSSFFQRSTVYLGHYITKEKSKVDLSGLKKEVFSEVPQTKKHLKRILGYIYCFRPYISNLSKLTADLNEKLKHSKITWYPEDSKTLAKIHELIHKQQELYFPNFTDTFHLYSDASEKGIA